MLSALHIAGENYIQKWLRNLLAKESWRRIQPVPTTYVVQRIKDLLFPNPISLNTLTLPSIHPPIFSNMCNSTPGRNQISYAVCCCQHFQLCWIPIYPLDIANLYVQTSISFIPKKEAEGWLCYTQQYIANIEGTSGLLCMIGCAINWWLNVARILIMQTTLRLLSWPGCRYYLIDFS